jgi:hypothetical protein
MKTLGIWLIALGTALVLVAFLVGNTISAEVPDFSMSSLTGPISSRSQEIANLPKIQLQTMIFQSGIALFLAGAIFTGCGTILEALKAQTPQHDSFEQSIAIEHQASEVLSGDLTASSEEPQPDKYGWLIVVVGGLLAALLVFAIASSQQNARDRATTEATPSENTQLELGEQVAPKPKRHR